MCAFVTIMCFAKQFTRTNFKLSNFFFFIFFFSFYGPPLYQESVKLLSFRQFSEDNMTASRNNTNENNYQNKPDENIYRTDKSFKEYWKTLVIWKYFPHLFSGYIFIYVLEKVQSNWDQINSGKSLVRILISLAVLMALPFLNIQKRRRISLTLTGCVLIIAVINLENVFGRRHCFLSLYYLLILFRIWQTRTFYDNFALCISFSADVSSLGNGNGCWYITSNLFLWVFFWISWIVQNGYRRNSLRIWEHLKVLIILNGKQKMEVEKRDCMINAHFNNDLIDYLFKSNEEVVQNGTDNDQTGRGRSSFFQKNKEASAHEEVKPEVPSLAEQIRKKGEIKRKEEFIQFAVSQNLIQHYDGGKVELHELMNLNGLEKKNSAVIAVKIDRGESDECAFVVDREQNVHQLIDLLAVQYNIKNIRRFGNVWVGLSGFFREEKAGGPNEKSSSHREKSKGTLPTVADIAQVSSVNVLHQHSSAIVNESETLGLPDGNEMPLNDLSADHPDLEKEEPLKKQLSIPKLKPLEHDKEKFNTSGSLSPGQSGSGIDRIGLSNSNVVEKGKQPEKEPQDKTAVDNESMEDCRVALRFCAELQYILNYCGIKLAAAVDFGPILGGFISSPHFDVFGQEIRWVLKTLDLSEYNHVLVSDMVRDQFHAKWTDKHLSKPQFQRIPIEYPWKKENYITLWYLSNGERINHEKDLTQKLLIQYSCLNLDELSAKVLNSSWFTYFEGNNKFYQNRRINRYYYRDKDLEKEINEDGISNKTEINNISTSNKTLPSSSHLTQPVPGDLSPGKNRETEVSENNPTEGSRKPVVHKNTTFLSQIFASYFEVFYYYENLAPEYRFSAQERWQVDLDDPFLQQYSEQELAQLITDLESKLYNFVFKKCFPSLFRLIFFQSCYDNELHGKPKEGKPISEQIQQKQEEQYNKCAGISEEQYDAPQIFNFSMPVWINYLPVSVTSFFSENFAKVAVTWATGDDVKDYQGIEENDTVNFDDPVSTTTAFYNRHYRGYFDYMQEARLFSHVNFINLGAELAFMFVAWFPILPILKLDNFTWGECVFVNFYILHCLVSRQLDKSFEKYGGYLLIVIILSLFASFPCYLVRELRQAEFSLYGDWGGEVSLLLLFSLRFSNNIKQLPWIAITEGVFLRIFFTLVHSRSADCIMSITVFLTAIQCSIILPFLYYFLCFRSYVSYMLEHHLLYYAAKQYEKQKENSADVFRVFNPQLRDDPNTLFNFRQLYRNSSIAVVHLKLADIGASLLEPVDFLKLLSALETNINKIFNDFGVVRTTNFSGIFLAVVARNVGQDGVIRKSNVSHNQHVLNLLKRVQSAIERFSIDNNFNVSVGVSVNTGNLYIGFLGNEKYCFDASGICRDIAITMASHNNENSMFISREFEPLIHSVIPNPEQLQRQFMKDERFGLYWLRYEGAVSGMQLQDFTYVGMLGKGGYGSVHLVTEKYTNENFAVKVIILKNSVMSRMIKRECIILQKMQHPNIVKFQYSFLTNNRLYLVMRYITGGNLKQVIERDAPSLIQLRIWFAELILAIEYIHQVGIIHRDIKPANCMIGSKFFHLCK
jgi:hypothetical protein